MSVEEHFSLLIYTTRPPGQRPLDEQAALAEHRALQDQLAASGNLILVARLDEANTAKTVLLEQEEPLLRDGPYLEAKEWLVGFYVVSAPDWETVAEHASRLLTPDGQIRVEIRPTTWMRR